MGDRLEILTDYQLPITNYQSPITHYPSPITHHPSPITNYPIMTGLEESLFINNYPTNS